MNASASSNPTPSSPQEKPRRWLLPALLLLLVAAVVAQGLFSRDRTMRSLHQATREEAAPRVHLIAPRRGPATRGLDLPGNVAAWYEAPIYGQVSGYVTHWFTDYGAPVRAGQALATIDTPDLDEQLDQARSDLLVAQARHRLALLTARRWSALSGTQAVSQQQVDVYASDAEAQQAQVTAQEHVVKRFEAREGFKTLRAPFDGVVTARRTDVGDYVNASGGTTRDGGSQMGRSSELFRVADMHEMRLFVAVPQDNAAAMKPGVEASFTVPQQRGRLHKARFLTTARAVTPESRTVITELTASNEDGSLWPGSYASVHFTIPADPNVLTVPSSAVLFRAQGLMVCVIRDGRVHRQAVKAGLDFGETMQITEGLKPGDRLVASPSENLEEGETVVVEPDPPHDKPDGKRI